MRPAIISALILVVGVGVWSFPNWSQSGPSQQLLQDGRKFSERQIDYLLARFSRNGIQNTIVKDGTIQVQVKDRTKCNKILETPEFAKIDEPSKKQEGGFASPFLPPSEKERLAKQSKLNQIEGIIAGMEGMRDAVIFHDSAKPENFSRRFIQTANITLWSREGHVITALQAATARKILSNSIAGLEESDILVVDGDTGVTFPYQQNSATGLADAESQRELELTRKQIEIQSRNLLSRFGNPEIVVRMDLEKRPLPINRNSTPTNLRVGSSPQESRVVPNGTGSISEKPKKSSDVTPKVQPTYVVVKKLLGIDVLLKRDTVIKHIRERHGLESEISDEQFSRGVSSLRNEVTKDLVRWLRSQTAIEAGSDFISVSIAAETPGQSLAETAPSHNLISGNMTPIIATIGILGAILLFAFSWKSRKGSSSLNESVSGGGRSFVNRNQSNAGRELAEEANDVVHSTPGNSARAFQNLVAGETK